MSTVSRTTSSKTKPSSTNVTQTEVAEEGEFSLADLMADDARRAASEQSNANVNGDNGNTGEVVVEEGEFSLADLMADNQRRTQQEQGADVKEGEFTFEQMVAQAPTTQAPVVQEGEFSFEQMIADAQQTKAKVSPPKKEPKKIGGTSTSADTTNMFGIGARVLCDFQNAGQYYKGTIVKVHKDSNKVDIHYDDNDKEFKVDIKRLRIAEEESTTTDMNKKSALEEEEEEELLLMQEQMTPARANAMQQEYNEGSYSIEDMMKDRARLETTVPIRPSGQAPVRAGRKTIR
jgi:hypothetical protein